MSPSAEDPVKQAVVYDEDDRQEVYEVNDPAIRRIAERSVLAMALVPGFADDVAENKGRTDVVINFDNIPSNGEIPERNLCSDVAFFDQPALAACSATLIAPDILLTAGHCFTDADGAFLDTVCPSAVFMLGYYFTEASQTAPEVPFSDLYLCKEVLLHRDFPGGAASEQKRVLDYAVVQLDRSVSGGEPVPIRTTDDALEEDTPVAMIGFPAGVPAKVDLGGRVTDSGVDERLLFAADVDAFAGNSGSGVFMLDGTLAGHLVGGQDDYLLRGGCNATNVVETSTSVIPGEQIAYVSRVLEAMCDADLDSAYCDLTACPQAVEIVPDTRTVIEGFLGSAHTKGTCGGGDQGREQVYAFEVTEEQSFLATASGPSAVLYVRRDCEASDSQVSCNKPKLDKSGDSYTTKLQSELSPGRYYLFVDGTDATSNGSYQLDLRFGPPGAFLNCACDTNAAVPRGLPVGVSVFAFGFVAWLWRRRWSARTRP